MWTFWIMAGALAAAAAALVASFAARAARRAKADDADPSTAVYKRQLEEVRGLADRGLLGAEEARAAEAEAGRRLLANTRRLAAPWSLGGRKARAAVLIGGGAAALLGLALYAGVGSPGRPDQPFRTRLQAWRKADPTQLEPEQMTAVLAAMVKERPRDPTGHEFLGRAQLAAGDAPSAVQSFARAARLSPGSADLQAELGEAITLAGGGKVTPDAEAAFRRTLALEPANVAARYFLGRARQEAGDVPGALALWRPLASALAPSDPRRVPLLQEIAAAEQPAPASPRLDAETATMARGMVARLAGRLKSQPNDPEGWARLVRAYGVLGDRAAQTAALTQARTLFQARPEVLARIEAEARGPAPAR